MTAWKRFPVPEFDYNAFLDMAWEAPTLLSADEARKLADKLATGDESVCGGYVVMPDDGLFDRFSIRGEHRHAVMCLLPNKPVRLLVRSHAWKIQRAILLHSLEPGNAQAIFDWKTPRPMSTRLGPDEGVTVEGGVYYLITGHKYADYWIGNRTIIENGWLPAESRTGFRVLSASDEDINDFHHCYHAFDWPV